MNAFALPGRRLVIHSGLIRNAQGPDEVAGVLAHELAHSELGHIRQKLIKEAGLTLLMAWISGNLGFENNVIHEMARVLSSTAFDRKYESEADRCAVEYLKKAGVNPNGLAKFMDRLAKNESAGPIPMEWLSTHPASAKRAQYIRQSAGLSDSTQYQISLEPESWKALQNAALPQQTQQTQ